MRLAPVVLFFHPDREAAIEYAAESSRTTHGTAECLDACRLLAAVLCAALDGVAKDDVVAAGECVPYETPHVAALARGEWRTKGEDQSEATATWCGA